MTPPIANWPEHPLDQAGATNPPSALDAMRTSVIGSLTGCSTVTVERGPVARFADAISDPSLVFREEAVARNEHGLESIAAPPTYAFSALSYWGTFPEDQRQSDADEASLGPSVVSVLTELLSRGGVTLHAEERLVFTRPLLVGDRLHRVGRVVDRYEKVSSERTLTFVELVNEYHDEQGALVLSAHTTLVHSL